MCGLDQLSLYVLPGLLQFSSLRSFQVRITKLSIIIITNESIDGIDFDPHYSSILSSVKGDLDI